MKQLARRPRIEFGWDLIVKLGILLCITTCRELGSQERNLLDNEKLEELSLIKANLPLSSYLFLPRDFLFIFTPHAKAAIILVDELPELKCGVEVHIES